MVSPITTKRADAGGIGLPCVRREGIPSPFGQFGQLTSRPTTSDPADVPRGAAASGIERATTDAVHASRTETPVASTRPNGLSVNGPPTGDERLRSGSCSRLSGTARTV